MKKQKKQQQLVLARDTHSKMCINKIAGVIFGTFEFEKVCSFFWFSEICLLQYFFFSCLQSLQIVRFYRSIEIYLARNPRIALKKCFWQLSVENMSVQKTTIFLLWELFCFSSFKIFCLTYFQRNLIQRREALTSGKECFLEIVKEECPEEKFKLIEENYSQLVTLLTEKPKDNGACTAPYFQLEEIECNAHKHALQLEMQEQTGEKETHDGAVKVLKMCKNAEVR